MAALWIPLDPIPRDCCLEVIRGSHQGVTYNGSRFELDDDTAPLYVGSDLPRLPDIESERDDWDIVGEALAPGDLIAFHMGCLHGGGATRPGMRRRSLVLRFIGDDVMDLSLCGVAFLWESSPASEPHVKVRGGKDP